jgi:hypothetical protein
VCYSNTSEINLADPIRILFHNCHQPLQPRRYLYHSILPSIKSLNACTLASFLTTITLLFEHFQYYQQLCTTRSHLIHISLFIRNRDRRPQTLSEHDKIQIVKCTSKCIGAKKETLQNFIGTTWSPVNTRRKLEPKSESKRNTK